MREEEQEAVPSVSSVQSVDQVSPGHRAEPAVETENLQNELHPALSAAQARALLDAVEVEPLPPHPVHGPVLRDELSLLVRGRDGKLRELARRVVSEAQEGTATRTHPGPSGHPSL